MNMSSVLAFSRLWNEGAAVFSNSGYALFNIEAQIVCIAVLVILFVRQQNSSGQTESQLIWSRMLFIQILYCLSGIFRVLADIDLIPKSGMSQYITAALNFGLFGCLCWLTFIYTEASRKSELVSSLSRKILAALPFIFNVSCLVLLGLFMDVTGHDVTSETLFFLMAAINLSYPAAALVLSVFRQNTMSRYERESISVMSIYPAFLLVCAPLQALNWRIPFLCYAIIISDIFVYINHADSLVSVDPLTKIPNRNGLIHTLSGRLGTEGASEGLYVFAVDIDDLGDINGTYGRAEGDRALIITANALQKFQTEEHECYISRYYGDEFIITADIQSGEELDLFTEHIRNYISNAVTSEGLAYHIRVSIGYSHYEQYSRTETISGLIEEAERMLAENKEQRKFQAIWRSRSTI